MYLIVDQGKYILFILREERIGSTQGFNNKTISNKLKDGNKHTEAGMLA